MTTQMRKLKKLKTRYAKYKQKFVVLKRKLKIGGTEKRKATLKKRLHKVGMRMDKLFQKMNAQNKSKSKRRKVQKKPEGVIGEQKTIPKGRVTVSPEMFERIKRAALRTFDAIAGDLLTLVRETGDHSIKQIEAIESVFDADRMAMYGGDEEAYQFCKQLDWKTIEKLGKKIFPYKSYS